MVNILGEIHFFLGRAIICREQVARTADGVRAINLQANTGFIVFVYRLHVSGTGLIFWVSWMDTWENTQIFLEHSCKLNVIGGGGREHKFA